jgi:hypothetical protein
MAQPEPSREVRRECDGYWEWFTAAERPPYRITGKYLFFSPDRERLVAIALEELESGAFHQAKTQMPGLQAGEDYTTSQRIVRVSALKGVSHRETEEQRTEVLRFSVSLFLRVIPICSEPEQCPATWYYYYVLCLYYRDDSRRHEIAARYGGREGIRYRYWKSDAATRRGEYSERFLGSLGPEERRRFSGTGGAGA